MITKEEWIKYKDHPINRQGSYLLICMDDNDLYLYYEVGVYDEKEKKLYRPSNYIPNDSYYPDEIIEYIPLPKL